MYDRAMFCGRMRQGRIGRVEQIMLVLFPAAPTLTSNWRATSPAGQYSGVATWTGKPEFGQDSPALSDHSKSFQLSLPEYYRESAYGLRDGRA
jgi:hypothetical protein